jgi:UDP-N-acetyl-D-mannosaminuronic acid dehydrogenase
MKVAVIGGAGHVGLPFSLVVGDSGHEVVVIDKNTEIIERFIKRGIYPYVEDGGKELLQKTTATFTWNNDEMKDCDVIAIMMGTPVDEQSNPRFDDILNVFKYNLMKYVMGKLIILRSTVAPGTTEMLKELIEKETKLVEGKDFHLVFCPERASQGHAIEESVKFPQLIGAFNDASFNKARDFFLGFVRNDIIQLTPKEAEFGKLMTNMYRYVNIALANEFYMIGRPERDVNIHKVTEAINRDYPRMDLPMPGPNVGGPCLFKDGKFLTQNIPYADLIQNAFLINEGMPQVIMNIIGEKFFKPNKVLILGAAFKAENEDTRNSLSFKLKKLCTAKGIEVVIWDHLVYPINAVDDFLSIDCIVVMTPHKGFNDLYETVLKKQCGGYVQVIDIWKLLEDSKTTENGVFELGEYQ